MVSPKVSIVIPCYNQGQFLGDAVDSVLSQDFTDYEIVIINDGSTEEKSIRILENFKRPQTQILHTENQGLASARNNGIEAACGKYILPLDADDRIEAGYLKQAVDLLEQNDTLGIVYCRAQLFDAVSTEWILPPYSLQEMLLDNIIFCSAMFRREDWSAVGGYDPGMIYGWEDYDFWLSLIERGREVYQIPEILFSYRVVSDSMVRSRDKWQKIAMFKRIFMRHQELFCSNIETWIESLVAVREHYYTSKLYVDSGNGVSDTECVSRKIEQTTAVIRFSLEGFSGVKGIRFDPVDVPAVLEIFEVTAMDASGKSSSVEILSSNAAFEKDNKLFFSNNDPQIFFNFNEKDLQALETLSVSIHFHALESDALLQIVELQQVCIADCGKPLAALQAMGRVFKKRLTGQADNT